MLSRTRTVDLISHVAAKTRGREKHPDFLTHQALDKLSGAHGEAIKRRDHDGQALDEADHEMATASVPVSYSLSPIDQFDHFCRIKAVLTYSDRHGGWIGLKNFINLYFSTVFHAFFGDNVDMHLIHVEKRKKFCAHFSLRAARSYRIIIMLNYRLWDKILLSSAALPDLYFRPPDRSYLEKAAALTVAPNTFHLGQPKDAAFSSANSPSRPHSPAALRLLGNDQGEQAANEDKWYDVSLAALCVVHRLEMIMFTDLRCNYADHVVTLGKFFANNNDIKNPFLVSHLYD